MRLLKNKSFRLLVWLRWYRRLATVRTRWQSPCQSMSYLARWQAWIRDDGFPGLLGLVYMVSLLAAACGRGN